MMHMLLTVRDSKCLDNYYIVGKHRYNSLDIEITIKVLNFKAWSLFRVKTGYIF